MDLEVETAADLKSISEKFSTFLFDQFGVLHNGRTPYPGARELLSWLHVQHKTIIILSNSGKRSAPNAARLEQLGFAGADIDLVITSGEVAWHLLKDGIDSGQMSSGAKCLFLGRDNDRSAIDGLDMVETDEPENADIVLLTGSRGDEIDMPDYRSLLAPAVERDVPCICTNPDKVMLTSVGPRFGAGAIAEEYEAMGGRVRWIGKPYPEIYQFALKLAGNPKPCEVCCLGDSIEHDIAGGANAGFSTILVRTGILAGEDPEKLHKYFETHGVSPDYIVDSLELES